MESADRYTCFSDPPYQRRNHEWAFLAAALLAIGLIQLGAMSVWVVVLSIALKVVLLIALVVALGVGLMFLWRRYKTPIKRSNLTYRHPGGTIQSS